MRTPTLTPTLERLENRIVLDTAAVPALLGSTTVNIYDTLQADSDIAPLAWESNLTLPDGVTHGRTPEAGADLRNAVLSPDGSGIFACSGDGGSWNLVSINAATGNTLHRIETAHTNAFSVAVTPDGKSLVTAGYDRTLKIWTIGAGGVLSLQKTVGLPQAAVNITMSPDGGTVTAMVAANGAMEFSVATGELKTVAPLRAGNVSDFTPDGKSLIAADGASMGGYDPLTGSKVADIGGLGSPIYALKVAPDGSRVAMGSVKGELVITPLSPEGTPVKITAPDGNAVFSLAWIGHSALAVGRMHGQIETYSIAGGQVTLVSSTQLPNYIDQLMVRGSDLIAVAERNGGPAGLFTTRIPESLLPLKPVLKANPLLESPAVPDTALTTPVDVRSSDQSLVIDDWNIPLTPSPISSPSPLTSRPLGWHVARPIPGLDIRSAVTSPDGQTLFACTGTEGGSWKLASVDAVTGELKEAVAAHSSAFDIAISPDGKTLVTGSYDHTLTIWDLASGKPTPRTTIPFRNAVLHMSVSPDGKNVVAMVAGSGAVQIDIQTGEQIVTPLRGGSQGTYTPDGRFLLASDGAKVAAFDPKTGQKTLDVGGLLGAVYALEIAPDGGSIAMGGVKGDVAIIPFLSDGSATYVCEAGGSAVQSLCWIGTSHLAVGKVDGTVSVYKVTDGCATLVSSTQLGNYVDALFLRGDALIAVGEQKNDPAGLFAIDLSDEAKRAASTPVETQERMLPTYRAIDNTELSRAMGVALLERLGLWCTENRAADADAIARRTAPMHYEKGGILRQELVAAVQAALRHGYEAVVMASSAAFDEELRRRTGVEPLGIDRVSEALRGGMYGPEIYQYVPKMPSAQEVRSGMEINFYKLYPMYRAIADRRDNVQAIHGTTPEQDRRDMETAQAKQQAVLAWLYQGQDAPKSSTPISEAAYLRNLTTIALANKDANDWQSVIERYIAANAQTASQVTDQTRAILASIFPSSVATGGPDWLSQALYVEAGMSDGEAVNGDAPLTFGSRLAEAMSLSPANKTAFERGFATAGGNSSDAITAFQWISENPSAITNHPDLGRMFNEIFGVPTAQAAELDSVPVQSGDTLSAIAARHNKTVAELLAISANAILRDSRHNNGSMIFPGDTIYLREPVMHTENLWEQFGQNINNFWHTIGSGFQGFMNWLQAGAERPTTVSGHPSNWENLDDVAQQKVLDMLSLPDLTDLPGNKAIIDYFNEHILPTLKFEGGILIGDVHGTGEDQCKPWLQKIVVLQATGVSIPVNKADGTGWVMEKPNNQGITLSQDQNTLEVIAGKGEDVRRAFSSGVVKTGDVLQMFIGSYPHTAVIAKIEADRVWVFDTNWGEQYATDANGDWVKDIGGYRKFDPTTDANVTRFRYDPDNTIRYHNFPFDDLKDVAGYSIYRISDNHNG